MTELAADAPALGRTKGQDQFLFAACFVALVATSFAFIIRAMLMEAWQIEFGFSETQKGEISGAGLWPFGLSIVLFSLIIDRVGYGKSMIFAFGCHVVSVVLMTTARGYWSLYVGSILNGLAAGTVEAIINPAIASLYPRSKTKMLTILHAGWPGGFVLGGIAIMFLTRYGIDWRVNAGIVLVPVVVYGLMLLKARFPASERVAAGVSYRDMLREAGAIGWLIVVYMVCMEINRTAGWETLKVTSFFVLPSWPMTIVMGVLILAYLAYARSLGRWMYVFLLLVMILLAITELGTDGWIKDLMRPNMGRIGLDSGWLIIYTATIMMVLRFCIAPIEKLLKPLGVLFFSSVLAAVGIFFLASAEGGQILLWATIYGVGQCFFWPVTLGLVSERFPRGGALTLNAIAGVGMLGVGIIGLQLLGFWQDTRTDAQLKSDPAAHARLMDPKEKESIFGAYRSLDSRKANELDDRTALYEFREEVLAKLPSDSTARAATAGFAELDRLLAADRSLAARHKEYQTLVRRAYDHLVRAQDDRADKTHGQMQQALSTGGIFPSAEQYADLRKDKDLKDRVRGDAKQHAMSSAAILPLIMAACYLALIIYFRAKGGYKVVELSTERQDPPDHAPTPREEVADAEATPSE